MKKLSVCSAVLFAVCSACASDEAARRPGATPQTEPEPGHARAHRHHRHDGLDGNGSNGVEPVKTADVGDAPDRLPDGTRRVDTEADAHARDVSGTPAVVDDRHAADNTRRNVRDRDEAATTPLDQGNHTSDLEITRKIRKAVTGDDTLSFDAKNVKIISEAGEVTLRGSVKTGTEKQKIETYARQAVGAGHVHNEISAQQ